MAKRSRVVPSLSKHVKRLFVLTFIIHPFILTQSSIRCLKDLKDVSVLTGLDFLKFFHHHDISCPAHTWRRRQNEGGVRFSACRRLPLLCFPSLASLLHFLALKWTSTNPLIEGTLSEECTFRTHGSGIFVFWINEQLQLMSTIKTIKTFVQQKGCCYQARKKKTSA